MRVGSFSVQIPEGRERDSGHVVLDHGRQYTIRLGNHQGRPCDATVTVDGKDLGGFRVYPHNYITLERSPNDDGRFTFYLDGSAEGVMAGLGNVASSDKGLIQVRFVSERKREPVRTDGGIWIPPTERTSGPTLRARGPGGQSMGGEEKTSGGLLRGAGPAHFAPGGTGVSGHSSQQFVTVADLDGDEAEAVTISIRLVGADNSPRPLKAVQPRANAVPDPVG